MKKRITIKEIAEKAEVSIGTVDRVLHNRGRVAASTRTRILEIAREGNYSSNVFARHLKLNKIYEVAAILPFNDAYWQMHVEGIEKGMADYEELGISLQHYQFVNPSLQSFESVLAEAISKQPDGLILAPTILSQSSRALAQLDSSGIPYVFVDSNIEGNKSLTFIGQHSFHAGQLAARLLLDGLSETDQLLILTLEKSDLVKKAVQDRIDGCVSFINGSGRTVRLNQFNLENEQKDIRTFLNEINDNDGMVGIFVPNSQGYLVGDVVNEVLPRNRVLGFDLTDRNIKCLNAGGLDFVIHQKPQMQGYLAVQTLYRYLVLRAEVQKMQLMPVDIIVKENLAYVQ
ncbi:MAG: LacI family DNA-binding transcriptional regulator [Cyclobacteriaceae bacterium]